MALLTLNLTFKQAKQLHRVLAASIEAYNAGIHPTILKRKGGKENEAKAEKRHHRANNAVLELLKTTREQAQAANELPEPLRTIVATLQEKGINAKVERVAIQSQPKESE